LGAEAAAAHLGWVAAVAVAAAAVAAPGTIRRSPLTQYQGGSVGSCRPYIHIAQSPGRMATRAEAAEMRGGRWWEAAQMTCDCAAATTPTGWSRRDIRRRCESSPWWKRERRRSRAAVATEVAIDVVFGRACLTRILGIELAIIRQGATLDCGIDSDHHVHFAFHSPLSRYKLRCRLWYVGRMGALCSSSRSTRCEDAPKAALHTRAT
jgi:hypothetical protein